MGEMRGCKTHDESNDPETNLSREPRQLIVIVAH